uniref:Uncharacterized protein n=1 Tax=Megaselia scalaris TaxID=36166 RepID=T1GIU5_MEGSC
MPRLCRLNNVGVLVEVSVCTSERAYIECTHQWFLGCEQNNAVDGVEVALLAAMLRFYQVSVI